MSDEGREKDRLKVFISYSRRDLDIAEDIVAALEAHGFAALIDRRDLPYGEEWQAELADFIRSSDTVLWLISPDSIASKWCHWELGEVGRANKRLVPVCVRAFDHDTLPEALGRIQILPNDGALKLGRDLPALIETLGADRAWIKEATRLYDRAREWSASHNSPAMLLRGVALNAAEAWSRNRPRLAPPLASEVLELLLASRRGQARRMRWTAAGSLTVALIAATLAGFALVSRQRAALSERRAVASAELATKNEEQAIQQRDRALVAQSRFLAARARDAADRYDYGDATALALEALPETLVKPNRPFVKEAAMALWDILRRFPLKAVLTGHTSPIITAAFSPDGTHIITGGNDGARVWNAETGHQVTELKDASMGWRGAGTVPNVAYSPDGSSILTASWLGRAWIWNSKDYKLLQTLNGHAQRIQSAVYSRAGDRVLTASDDGTARIWDTSTGRPLVNVKLKDRTVNNAAFAPNGLLFATCSTAMSPPGRHVVSPQIDQGMAQVWDALKGTLLSSIVSKSGLCDQVLFSPDGSFLAVNETSNVVIWDVENKREVVRLAGHRDTITSVAFSNDQKRFATSSPRETRLWGTVNWDFQHTVFGGAAVFAPGGGMQLVTVAGAEADIWDTESGQQLQALKGHKLSVPKAFYSRDGRRIATVSDYDNTARIWNSEGGVIYDTFNVSAPYDEPQAMLSGMRFIDGGRKLVTGASFGSRLWQVDDGHPIMVLADKPYLRAIEFTSDGKGMLSSDFRNTAILYDVASGEVRSKFLGAGSDIRLHGAAISAEDSRLATWYSDGRVRLWDVHTQKVLTESRDVATGVVRAGFLRGGKFYVAYVNGTVRVSDRDGGGTVAISRADHKDVRDTAVSADGRILIEKTADNTAEIREIGSPGAPIVKTVGSRFLTTVAISADGRLAAIGANDGIVRVVETDTGKDRPSWEPKNGTISALKFTPDGKSLIAGTHDGVARIWDFKSGRETMVLPGHERAVKAIAVADDGSRIATATEGEFVRIWRMFTDDQALIDLGKSLAPQCLPQEKRREFGLDPTDVPRWCIIRAGLEAEANVAR